MAQKLQPGACTQALVALLSARLPASDSFNLAVDVKESGDKDFNDNGELILKNPAVRVWFEQAAYGDTRDISKTTLSATFRFQVVCRHTSLRGAQETRDRSHALTEAVLVELAGARLLFEDGTRSDPIAIRGVARTNDFAGIVQDCFSVLIEVDGFAQFDGRNANPQGGGQ